MSNTFGIPNDVEQRIRDRDKTCVYCNKKMIFPYDTKNRGNSATIEHFREAGPFYWNEGLKAEDIAICCGSCNSSRGVKSLPAWFKKPYCKERNISKDTVAEPVKKFLECNKI